MLSAMVMAGTAVPAATASAGETAAQAEPAPGSEDGGSSDGSGSESAPSEEPGTGSAGESGDDGGSSDSGDSGESGDDGGSSDSGSSDSGDSGESGDDGGSSDGGSSDSGNSGESGDDGGPSGEETGSEDENGGSADSSDDGEENASSGDTAEYAGEGETGSDGSGSGSTEQESPTDGTTAEPGIDGTAGATAEIAKEVEPQKKDLAEDPEGAKEAENYNGTNEELLSRQHIVYDLPAIRKDFRFFTVDKVYDFSTSEIQIYEACSEDAEVVGTIAKNGVLFELEDEDNDWYYVESGAVRGFVKGDQLIRGDDADQILEIMEKQAERISTLLPEGISKDAYFFYAQETVPYYENDAYSFRRITTQDTVIDKQAALAREETGIMEERDEDAREAGLLDQDSLAYVIEDTGDGWLFVESGDVRGFVKASKLDRSAAASKKVDEAGEQNLSTAKEEIAPSDNRATYYTLTSVKEGAKYNEVREKILEKALSCVGNPYVWGGTSLTNGADCSGFVQTLYSLFGYHLPRVAAAQSTYGTQIPVSDAAPGDLIFFARNGYVYHVAMYAGDGKTVEAYSTNYGIITKELSDREAVWATRIIED